MSSCNLRFLRFCGCEQTRQFSCSVWFLEVQKLFTHWENSNALLHNTYGLFDGKCVCLLNSGEYNMDTSTVNIHWLFIQRYTPPSPCRSLLTSLITRTLHSCCNLLHEGLLSWQRDTWGYRSTNNPSFNIYIWMLTLMCSVTLWKDQIAWSAFYPSHLWPFWTSVLPHKSHWGNIKLCQKSDVSTVHVIRMDCLYVPGCLIRFHTQSLMPSSCKGHFNIF